MSEHLIDGMTSKEWVIYNKGYTKGLDVGEAVTEERIIKLLQDEIDFMWSGVGLVQHDPVVISHIEGLIALIKGEK